MFSNNNQISKRQLFRLSIAGNLGTAVLVFPKLAVSCGILAPVAAGILACIYIYAVNVLGRYMDKNKFVNFVLRLFTVVKYSLILIVMILILSDIVSDILLPGVSVYVVCGACMLTALYVCGNIENISRGAEVLYYFIIIPVLLLCVLSISSADITSYTQSGSWFFGGIKGGIKSMMSVPVAVILFVPAEIAVFVKTKDRADLIKEPFKATCVATVISIAVYLLAYGILGPAVNVGDAEKYPLMGLARLTGLPGGFMERQDTLISIFLVISIIYGMAMSIYAITHAMLLKKEKNSTNIVIKSIVALLAIIISSAIITGNILPDFKGLKKSNSTEIENRNYVLAMGIDYEEGKYYVSMAFADFTKLSGEAPDGSANNRTVYTGTGADAAEFSSGKFMISDEYDMLSDKMTDFSHIKVIILGKSIADSSDLSGYHRENLKKYFQAMTHIGRNTLVAVSDKKAVEVIECEENIKSSVGMYIYSMMKNNGYKKCNVSRLMSAEPAFPVITVDDGLPAIVR